MISYPDSANCQRVMQSVSSGMYASPDNFEITDWCLKLMIALQADFKMNKNVS